MAGCRQRVGPVGCGFMRRFAGSRWAAIGAAALVGVLLAIVAVVATDLPGTVSTSSFDVDAGAVREITSPIMRLVYAIVLLIAIYRWMLGTRVGKRGRRRAPVSPWAVLASMALLAAVVLLVLPNLHFQGSSSSAISSATSTTVVERGAGSASDAAPSVGADVWVVVAAVVAALAFLLLRRRTRPDSVPQAPPTSSTGQISVWVEHDLGAGDSRSRVLAAYHRVARRAAERGWGRAASETVTAHLRRIGGRAGAEPTARLAGLYNRARFSAHPTSDSEADSAEIMSRQIEKEMERD